MRKIFIILLWILLGVNFKSRACAPLNTPSLLSQTVIAQNLILDWQTTTIWYNCPDVIQVEIACDAAAFTGAANATYSSAIVSITSTPMSYPTMSINLANFCPGAYKFRAREANSGPFGGTFSPWTSNFTFTVPGVYVPPVLTLTASLPNICPPQSNTLTANIANGCGGSSNTYQWLPTTGLSCPTCSSTVASPTVTTDYTLTVTGGQIGCWTQTAVISVIIAPVQAIFGPIGAVPASICAGQTTTISMAYFNSGLVTWQSASNSTGPWTNLPNSGGPSYASGPLISNTYFRASVVGCQTIDSTNTVFINVNPNPTITVSTTTICPGQTSTLTGSGATSYQWSPGAFPTGINTGGAAPLSTTSYTVTGNLAGCTGTTVATVSVNPSPTINVNNPTACINGTINFTGSGGVAYYWTGPNSFTSSLQNPTLTNAQASLAGQYQLMVTSPVGCTNVATSNVVVQALPVPVIGNNNPVCLNASLFLYGSNVGSYSWAGPNGFVSAVQNPTIANVTNAAAGVYTLIGTVGTCTASVTRTITIQSIPSPTAQTNSPICVGKPIYLTGLGGTTYTWTGPPAFSSQSSNPTIATANINNAGVFTLTVRGANTCTNSTTATVVINPLPIIPVTNLSVCVNQPINLTSGGGNTYNWTGPAGFSSGFQNPVIASASLANTGTYNTTVTSVVGCSNTAVTSVTVLSLPNAIISTSTPSLCAGKNLILSGLGGTTYTWTGPNGFTSNLQNVGINNISTLADGIYSLGVTFGICSGVTTKSITVFALPTPTYMTNSPVCEDQVFVLNAGGPPDYVFEWLGPNNFLNAGPNYTNNSVPLTFTGIYTLNVMDKNNCRSTSVASLVVHPIPIIEVYDVAACEGQPAVLLSNGGVTYNWFGPGGYTSSAANATVTNVTNSTAGTYVVVVSSVNSCTNSAQAIVSVKALPVPSLAVTPKACINSTVNLMGFGGDSYRWDGPFDFASTKQNTTFTATSMSYSGIYTLSVLNSGGCVGYTTALVEIYTLPDGVLTTDNDNRCVPFCTNFELENSNAAPILDYTWMINSKTFNQQYFNYCFTDPGEYVIRGSFLDVNGCTNATTYTINAYKPPVADFVYLPAKPVEMLDQVIFSDMSGGEENTQWNWYFVSNTGYKSNSKSANYVFDHAGKYRVAMVVTNKWGCADTIVKLVEVDPDFSLYVPDVFTPNEDGRNDIFQPKGRGIVKYDLRIYDRWGERLFQTNDFPTGWDGTFNGKKCKSEVYVWEIVASDAYGKVKELSGHVTLYR